MFLARIWVLFAHIWSKMNFRGNTGFKYSNYYSKMLELMDGQTNSDDFIGPSTT